MKLRNAAYLAIFLHFARKTFRKMSPESAGRPGRWLAIYPYSLSSAIVGSFHTQQQAEDFRRRLREHIRCQITTECLDDWKGKEIYGRIMSVFDFRGNDEHWPQVPDFAARHGQNRITTDPTEANAVLTRWRNR